MERKEEKKIFGSENNGIIGIACPFFKNHRGGGGGREKLEKKKKKKERKEKKWGL